MKRRRPSLLTIYTFAGKLKCQTGVKFLFVLFGKIDLTLRQCRRKVRYRGFCAYMNVCNPVVRSSSFQCDGSKKCDVNSRASLYL